MSHTAVSGDGAEGASLPERWQVVDHPARCELIVTAALGLLHERGRPAVTMRAVAGRLGVGAMTLYTYFDSQEALWRGMVRRGFERLHAQCEAGSTLGTDEEWRGSARQYLQFAIEQPNLYKLMFDTPVVEDDSDLLAGGFEALLEKVRHRLREQGGSGQRLECEARRSAGRYWIALHGLATLAIAGRLSVLEGDLDTLLDDLLTRVAPT